MPKLKIIKTIKNYIVRSIGLLFYFTSFPFIIYGVFNIPFGILYLIVGVSLMLMGIMMEINVYGNSKRAFKKLAIITLIPLLLFTIFNIALTAGVANAIRGELEGAIEETPSKLQFFVGIALENYKRIIPGLWITAMAYALMVIILFRISSQK